ncbi:MAG: hypothetical protein JRI72_00155 [Deltaproteobacteria bacterium]|nr:hypothetical protein [Deltaproteobacteria bacterium]
MDICEVQEYIDGNKKSKFKLDLNQRKYALYVCIAITIALCCICLTAGIIAGALIITCGTLFSMNEDSSFDAIDYFLICIGASIVATHVVLLAAAIISSTALSNMTESKTQIIDIRRADNCVYYFTEEQENYSGEKHVQSSFVNAVSISKTGENYIIELKGYEYKNKFLNRHFIYMPQIKYNLILSKEYYGKYIGG